MEAICRLCCSTKFVNNCLFDEENALYLKMELYLPFKVKKMDRLPQKVCDRCSCKVNDLYQFCNEAIEAQARLREMLQHVETNPNDSVNLSDTKQELIEPSPSALCKREQSTQTELYVETSQLTALPNSVEIQIKVEPTSFSPTTVKTEDKEDIDVVVSDHFDNATDLPTDISEDNISLLSLKKKKRGRKPDTNGEVKRSRKKKPKDWELLINTLPSDTAVTIVEKPTVPVHLGIMKEEVEFGFKETPEVLVKVKKEPTDDTYQCCICFTQCFNRNDMLRHYNLDELYCATSPEPAVGVPRVEVVGVVVVVTKVSLQGARGGGRGGRGGRARAGRAAAARRAAAALPALPEGGGGGGVGGALGAALGARPAPLHVRALREVLPRPAPDPQARSDAQDGRSERGPAGTHEALRLRPLPRGLRLHEVPAGAPRARAPRGGGARAGAALRGVRARLRAPQLAAPPPARALRRAQLPLQRVRQGAHQPRAPQVPHPDTHRIQAERLQGVRQRVREEVQPDAARARALGREAARVLALRQGLQPALHPRHTRTVPQWRAAVRVRAVRARVCGQGAAVHAPQDHLHLAARTRDTITNIPATARPARRLSLRIIK